MDNLQPPDQETLEKAIRDLFKEGDITETARHSRIPRSTLYKQLNPDDTTESIAYEFLMLLYGAEKAKRGLGEALWAIVSVYARRMLADGQDASLGEAIAVCANFAAVAARREDGMRTPEELELARQEVLETVERIPVYKPSAHLRNLA